MAEIDWRSGWWWGKRVVLTVMGCGFLLFGVQVLIGAYGLTDPFTFVLTFFASNLIILISAAIVLGLVWQIAIRLRNRGSDEDV